MSAWRFWVAWRNRHVFSPCFAMSANFSGNDAAKRMRLTREPRGRVLSSGRITIKTQELVPPQYIARTRKKDQGPH